MRLRGHRLHLVHKAVGRETLPPPTSDEEGLSEYGAYPTTSDDGALTSEYDGEDDRQVQVREIPFLSWFPPPLTVFAPVPKSCQARTWAPMPHDVRQAQGNRGDRLWGQGASASPESEGLEIPFLSLSKR
jgi:hypothetical protein